MTTFYYVSFTLYGLRNAMVFKGHSAMSNFIAYCEDWYGKDFEVTAFFERIV